MKFEGYGFYDRRKSREFTITAYGFEYKKKIKKITKLPEDVEIISETPYSYKVRCGAVEYDLYKFEEVAKAFQDQMEFELLKQEIQGMTKKYDI